MPVYKIMQQKNDLKMAEFTVVSALRRAQVLAQAAEGDSDWGTHIENSQISIFKGANYANRDVISDEKFPISSRILPSGLADVIFDKLTGLPEQTGQIILSSSDDSKIITINEKGAVEY